MDEQELVAVLVAHEMVHRPVRLPVADPDVAVRHERRGVPRRAPRGGQLAEVVRVRNQRARETVPRGRRMLVMEMRGRAEEPLLAHLAFERPRRQVGVRLPAVRAVRTRKTDVVLHGAPRGGGGFAACAQDPRACDIVERLPVLDKRCPRCLRPARRRRPASAASRSRRPRARGPSPARAPRRRRCGWRAAARASR